ncbi:MAG: hypothetical protein U1D30_24060 [Planctomycetota bacterium]
MESKLADLNEQRVGLETRWQNEKKFISQLKELTEWSTVVASLTKRPGSGILRRRRSCSSVIPACEQRIAKFENELKQIKGGLAPQTGSGRRGRGGDRQLVDRRSGFRNARRGA